MTLLLCTLAAAVTTLLWYRGMPQNEMHLGTLALIYWGAALMWTVDAVAEYRELGAAYFAPAFSQMVNDAFLGLSVIALGLVIWLGILLVKDPKNVLFKKS